MQRQRKRQPEWSTILGWVLGIGMVFAAIPVSAYVTGHQTAAAPYLMVVATVITFGMMAAGFVGKVPLWIMGMTVGFCGGFTMITANAEGWLGWVQNMMYAFSALVLVSVIVGVFRLNWRLSAINRTIGEETHTDYLFRDDGQRILVHADKRKLAGLIFLLAIIVAIGTLMLFIPKMPWFMLVLLIASIGLVALTTLLCAVRFALPGPTLVIDPDGLRDNSSVFAFGRGLLRWDEILNVFVFATKTSSGVTHRNFAVLLKDGRAVQRRMPAWKRLFAFPFGIMGPDMFVITRSLLDRTPDELVTEIKRYAAEHAPNGWRSPLIENADDGATEILPGD